MSFPIRKKKGWWPGREKRHEFSALPPTHIAAIDLFLSQIEAKLNLPVRIGIEACIETAEGLTKAEAIAASSDRVEALVFGVADFATSVRLARSVVEKWERMENKTQRSP
ncbi:MAG: aldolase/citrate lyase family protein [Desulfovermiculus sp.]